MRAALLAVVLATASVGRALAAPPDIDRSADGMLEVTDFGTYRLALVGKSAAPDTVSGTQNTVDDVALLRPGSEVCAVLGTSFGMRYQVSGDLPDPLWRVEVQADHPMLHYANGNSGTHGVYARLVTAGTETYNGWTFEEPGELEPGDFTFTILRGGEVKLRKTFHVRVDCSASVS